MMPHCLATSPLQSIICDNRIEIHFQPIISTRKKTVIGMEALSRGINQDNHLLIPPKQLFLWAEKENLCVELDRLCRIHAMQQFKKHCCSGGQMLLFFNLDTSILDASIVGSNHIINLANQLGLKPENIVIEILESENNDLDSLQQFIQNCRHDGFLIALDDVGNRYSNLDRILLTKPDILKIDRQLVQNIDKDYYKKELFKSLVLLAKKTGALIVAEGVETKEEALACFDYGVDFLQGFYFSKPQKMNENMLHQSNDKIAEIANLFRGNKIKEINDEQVKFKLYNYILQRVLSELHDTPAALFENKLSELIKPYPMLEYFYILDGNGIQITESVCSNHTQYRTGGIFQPARRGADQSLKEYYLFIQAGAQEYRTEPYMSLATGKSCITCANVFTDNHNQQFILCADFNP